MTLIKSGAVAVAVGAAMTLASGVSAANIANPYGEPTAATAINRTIEISPDARYVNVAQGENIQFVSQGKTFNWNFNTFGTRPFALAAVAPSDFDTRNVEVYVDKNPLYGPGR